MKLSEYLSFEEKGKYFKNGEIPININLSEIFDELERFQVQGSGFIYRGCSEAKFKMYNSAQRLYMNQDLHLQVPKDRISEHYSKFITELISSAGEWNNGVISKLLSESGINPKNSIALLSYMQHYGLPTPFLDFTFNPYIALFFAIENMSYQPSDNPIDNYFSLYYSFQNNTAFEIWKYVFDKDLEDDNIPYESVDAKDMSIILPSEELYKIVNSLNIVNQEGLFFYNNHPWYPIERTYIEYITYMKEELGDKKFEEVMLLNEMCGCFNIHKSLAPLIREKLNNMGITRDYIYPSIEKFKEEVAIDAIKKILSFGK